MTATEHDPRRRAQALHNLLRDLRAAHPDGRCTHDPEYDCTPAIYGAELNAADVAYTTHQHAHRLGPDPWDHWHDQTPALGRGPVPALTEALAGKRTTDTLTTAAAAAAAACAYLEDALPARPGAVLHDPADAHVIATQLAHIEHSLANIHARLGHWAKALGDRSVGSREYATADPDGSNDQIQSSMRTVARHAEAAADHHRAAAGDTEAMAGQLSWHRLI